VSSLARYGMVGVNVVWGQPLEGENCIPITIRLTRVEKKAWEQVGKRAPVSRERAVKGSAFPYPSCAIARACIKVVPFCFTILASNRR
jgi:hypothetical protein